VALIVGGAVMGMRLTASSSVDVAAPPVVATSPPVEAVAVSAPAAPAAASSQDPMLALAEAIQKEIAISNGRFGIAIKDLGSGQTILMNDRMSFSAASLFKLPVMYEAFRQRQTGNLNFDSELTVTDTMAQYDLGTLAWPIGTRVTVGTALERMIIASDNVSAVMLLQLIGANQINQEMAALGLESTSIGGSRLSTSARDMMTLMEMITTGKAIDEKTSAEMLHLMRRQLVRNRIPALLPAETPVGNKTGNWEDYAHDVGMVFSPKSTYAIAVLTQGAGEVDGAHTAIARISRMAYDQFNRADFNTTPIRMPLETTPSYASVPRVPANASVPRFNGPPTAANQPGIPAAVVQQQTQPTPQRSAPPGAAQPTASSRSPAQPVAPAPAATSSARPANPAPSGSGPSSGIQVLPTPMPTPRGYDIVQRRVEEAQRNRAPTAGPQPQRAPTSSSSSSSSSKPTAQATPRSN
jgi:beta-lactamase class A